MSKGRFHPDADPQFFADAATSTLLRRERRQSVLEYVSPFPLSLLPPLFPFILLPLLSFSFPVCCDMVVKSLTDFSLQIRT